MPAVQPPVHRRPPPDLLGPRLGIGQRRPVRGGRLGPGPGVPGRDAHVEAARAVHPVGLGGELVDGRRVDGVLPLPGALDVPVLAAPRAEEVSLEPLAVRAATAAALRDKRRPSPAATGGPAVEARLAACIPSPAGLAGPLPLAAGLRARPGFLAAHGGRHEALGEPAAPLGDEQLNVHGVLRGGDAEVRRSPDGGVRAQAGHPAPAGPERQRRTRRVDRPSTRATMGAARRTERSRANGGWTRARRWTCCAGRWGIRGSSGVDRAARPGA